MVVIKRAFSLYDAHSKTSGVAQSSSGKVAVREYSHPDASWPVVIHIEQL